jgi:poly-gamma-glutamate synthesis protein (capsule biosynthesis protein)
MKKLFALITACAAAGALVRGQGAAMGDAVLQPLTHNVPQELAMKITEPFTFAAVGDIIIRRPVGIGDPGYQALTKVMRDADVTYANMEGPIADEATFQGPLAGGPKSVVDELKNMGVRIMTSANNHSMDAGDAGMYETNRLLDGAGIVHAGTGKNLADAREARIAPTKKGTVAVLGMFSVDPSSSPEPSRYFGATNIKAGLNALRVTPYNTVTADQMRALKQIRDSVYARRGEVGVPVAPVPANEPADRLELFRAYYKVGEQPGNLSYEIDPADLRGIVTAIRTGKQLADFMVVAIHCHQNSFAFQAYSHDNSTPDFLVRLAHTAIDNGADVFVAHGVHTVRGVEIYKGKPIFYGVSNFFYQQDPSQDVVNPNGGVAPGGGAAAQVHQPDDLEALMVTAHFENGKLVEARLYPADLGIEHRPTSKMGNPSTPTAVIAKRILEKVQTISKPFGTTIAIENGVGVIRVPTSNTQ